MCDPRIGRSAAVADTGRRLGRVIGVTRPHAAVGLGLTRTAHRVLADHTLVDPESQSNRSDL